MSPAEGRQPGLISIAIKPKEAAGDQALRAVLEDFAQNDPFLSFHVDEETGLYIVYGVSELHLDSIVGAVIARGIGVDISAPQVAFVEALTRTVEIEYTHNRPSGAIRQFARVKLRLEPNRIGGGNVFASEVTDSAVLSEHLLGVEKGVRSVLSRGVLVECPMVDVKVTLLDGAYRKTGSSAMAFQIASRIAMQEGCRQAGVKLLEPIMDLEVEAPSESVSRISDDLNASRAQVRSLEVHEDGRAVIRALAPLERLFGCASRLRTLSDDRATHRMAFSHYQEVPRTGSTDPDATPPAAGIRA